MELIENVKNTCPLRPASTAPASPASPASQTGLKEKIKRACRVRNVILFCLISLFLWWGSNSVVKYWSQPLSTDISFEYGDSDLGIQFPLITLCQDENPIINECDAGSWDYDSIIVSCMTGNKTFQVTIAN